MSRLLLSLATCCSLLTTPAHSTTDFGPQPTAQTQKNILQLREQAWLGWFNNDIESFTSSVPNELVAIGWSGGAFSNRNATLEQMSEFALSGTKLTALQFPENIFQQYGDVVILYTRFQVTLTTKEGVAQVISGRGTEIFVQRNKQWIHTGWHLDPVSDNNQ